MKLRTKLIISFLAACIIPLSVIGIISLNRSKHSLSDQAFRQLESVRELKKAQLNNYFIERQIDIDALIQTVADFDRAAFEKLKASQNMKKTYIEGYFRKCRSDIAIISKNSIVEKALDSFSSLFDENGNFNMEMYTFNDEFNFKDSLKQFKEEYGYHDVLIIGKQGTVVYALNRGSDLGQNVINGKLKDTALNKCFQKGIKGLSINDFEFYQPDEQHICFIAAPIVRYGEPAGIIVLKLDKTELGKIVNQREGMGKTGESYIVGKTDSIVSYRADRIVKPGKIGDAKSGKDIEKAFSGESGSMIKIGSQGHTELSSYVSLNIPGLNWAIISSISLEEVIAPMFDKDKGDYFAQYIKKYGYHDLFLISPEGNLFYSVAHEADYGTNLINGQYKDTNLAKLFRQVSETKVFGFADFQPYPPSGGEPSAFIAQPVINQDKADFVVAVQMTSKEVNSIMNERSGMGNSGRTYLVGSDKLMRSDLSLDSRYSVKISFANHDKGRMESESVNYSLAGKSGFQLIRDYRGRPVLSAYSPLDVWGTRWALIAEIDEEEALADVKKLRNVIGGSALIFIVVIIAGSLWISGYITKPIYQVIDGLKYGSERITIIADQISLGSQETAKNSGKQSESVEETSLSLKEIYSKSRQNADKAEQAKKLTDDAHQIVTQANSAMSELSFAMSEIFKTSRETSGIIKSIDEIAFQTSLLSLNAAIEAARAGDTGTGFAVVADEVRNLAKRSGEASKNSESLISQNVLRINDGSDIISKTDKIFKDIYEITVKISRQISEIAADSEEQKRYIEKVNTLVAEISHATQQNVSNANESAGASEECHTMALQLKGFVEELAMMVG